MVSTLTAFQAKFKDVVTQKRDIVSFYHLLDQLRRLLNDCHQNNQNNTMFRAKTYAIIAHCWVEIGVLEAPSTEDTKGNRILSNAHIEALKCFDASLKLSTLDGSVWKAKTKLYLYLGLHQQLLRHTLMCKCD